MDNPCDETECPLDETANEQTGKEEVMPGILEGARKKAVEKTGELTRQASEKADVIKVKTAEASAALKETGFNQLSKMIEELNTAVPVLSAAGYQLVGAKLKLGMPPEFSVEFALN